MEAGSRRRRVKSGGRGYSARGESRPTLAGARPAGVARVACRRRRSEGRWSRRYTIVFDEWGQLGLAFSVFKKVVIPVVFNVEDPARSLGVTPASMLVSLNGTKIADLPEDAEMLDHISRADFPKTCVFRRPKHPLGNTSLDATPVKKKPGEPSSPVAPCCEPPPDSPATDDDEAAMAAPRRPDP